MKIVPYNYHLIVGPTAALINLLFDLRLIQGKSHAYMSITNGELHNLLVSLKNDHL